MHATRCLGSLLAVTTLVVVGCTSDPEDVVFSFCTMPAPLYGRYDERAPGYMFSFVDGVTATEEVARLAAEYPMEVKDVYDSLPGFSALMSEETMERIRCEPTIAVAEHDGIAEPGARARSAPRGPAKE